MWSTEGRKGEGRFLAATPRKLECKGTEREHELRGRRVKQTCHLARLIAEVRRPFSGAIGRHFRWVADGVWNVDFIGAEPVSRRRIQARVLSRIGVHFESYTFT